jgi:hypothetical protein
MKQLSQVCGTVDEHLNQEPLEYEIGGIATTPRKLIVAVNEFVYLQSWSSGAWIGKFLSAVILFTAYVIELYVKHVVVGASWDSDAESCVIDSC